MGFRLSTGVVEHISDLGREVRDNGRVEECVESCENDSADNNADDDLDTGIDVAFALEVRAVLAEMAMEFTLLRMELKNFFM